MPLLFLITEFVRSKYFEATANSLLVYLFKFCKQLRKLTIMDTATTTTKDDITFKKVLVYSFFLAPFPNTNFFFIRFYLFFFSSVFSNTDKQHSYETDGANVIVVGSTGSHTHGSSKIKLKNIVDYKWEVKNYIGRLIAVHIDGNYVAYAIKGK